MDEVNVLINEIIKFRDERDWEQFHDTKNLAIAISIEASELNELFLWKTVEESEKVSRDRIKEELADILTFSLLLAQKHGFNIVDIVREKVNANSKKYPVEKSKGTAKKYNEF